MQSVEINQTHYAVCRPPALKQMQQNKQQTADDADEVEGNELIASEQGQ
jgi:hypothetical protein